MPSLRTFHFYICFIGAAFFLTAAFGAKTALAQYTQPTNSFVDPLFIGASTKSTFDSPAEFTEYVEIEWEDGFSKADAILQLRNKAVDDYREHTNDPESVQGDHAEFLTAAIRRSTGFIDARSWKELKKKADELNLSECQDPLVQVYYAMVLVETTGDRQVVEVLKSSIAGFKESTYPARNTKLGAAYLMAIYQRLQSPDFSGVASFFADALIHWLIKDRRFGDEDVRAVYSELVPFFDLRSQVATQNDVLIAIQKRLAMAVGEDESLSPWLRNMILGEYHLRHGWFFRGDGYANTVSATNGEKFSEHMELSAEFFRKAWGETDDYPEPAARLISHAMTGHTNESTHVWFRRSEQAEIGYTDAHEKMLWALRPRWGGSHQQMLDFGRYCLSTRRFDTQVPMYYLRAILAIDSELNGKNYLRDDQIFADVQVCLNGMIAEAEKKADRVKVNYYRSLLFCLSIVPGKNDVALDQLERLEGPVSQRAFKWAGATYSPKIARARMYAKTGDRSELAIELPSAFEKSRANLTYGRDRTHEIFQLVFNGKFDKREMLYWQQWKDIYQMEKDYHAGKWVEIPFDEDFTYWVKAGNAIYQVEEDGTLIVGTLGRVDRPQEGARLATRPEFPGAKEIRCTIEVEETDFTPLAYGLHFGRSDFKDASGEQVNTRLHAFVTVENDFSDVALSRYFPQKSFFIPLPKSPHHLQLFSGDNYHDFRVNGERMKPTKGITTFATNSWLGVAAALPSKHTGDGKARVQKFRVKKWEAGPPPQDPSLAIRYYKNILERAPDDTQRWFDLAVVYHSLQRWDDMNNALEKAKPGSDKLRDIDMYLALAHEQRGEIELALELFRKHAQTPLARWTTYQHLAWILATSPQEKWRNKNEALYYATMALERDPTSWLTWHTMGAAYAEMGMYEKALAMANIALRKRPTDEEEALISLAAQRYQERKPLRESSKSGE